MALIAASASSGSPKKIRWAKATVPKNRPMGSSGSLPVKNSQSTAFIAANSAALAAKMSRMASGLPQTRRVAGLLAKVERCTRDLS